MRSFIRSITPQFILDRFRARKKEVRRRELEEDRKTGNVITREMLVADLKKAGIEKGDILLVHSSLSKIGFVEDGPKAVVEALLEVIGPEGNLLMPNSPNAGLQLEYIKSHKVFHVSHSPSALGAISEYFRKLPNALRSAHPTEPVSCIGPDAEYFTSGHFGQLTPYTDKSPFCRVSEKNGKILYLGVTLDNAGTNLHTLEDAVQDFRYPVYYPEVFEVEVVFPNGERKSMKTKVHNPEQSAKRKCDQLIPMFKAKGVMMEVKIGQTRGLLVDAKRMLEAMIEEYEKHGVTMYTPEGDK